jgi:hypothetical protein
MLIRKQLVFDPDPVRQLDRTYLVACRQIVAELRGGVLALVLARIDQVQPYRALDCSAGVMTALAYLLGVSSQHDFPLPSAVSIQHRACGAGQA